MEQQPYRSQRSINEEVAKAAAEKAEEDHQHLVDAQDALLDLYAGGSISYQELQYEMRVLGNVKQEEGVS